FGDVSGVLSNTSVLSTNLGGAGRYYDPAGDRIWGANVFYDYRDTGTHTFNQVAFGLESLGAWDARANVYLVTGPEQKTTGFFFTNPVVVQHNIQLDRVAVCQAAMSGFDAEVGVPLSCRYGLKVYAGTYNFQVADSPQAWGVKVRLEERVTDNLELNLSYA